MCVPAGGLPLALRCAVEQVSKDVVAQEDRSRPNNRAVNLQPVLRNVPVYSRPEIPTHEQRSVRHAATRGSPDEADDVRIVLAADDQDHH